MYCNIPRLLQVRSRLRVPATTAKAADTVIRNSGLILSATSFGGVESTWELRARWVSETALDSLIRLSAGAEPTADLITDIDHAREVL
jgi:cystathionine beta-lyase/cystathionine gamma-synthase